VSSWYATAVKTDVIVIGGGVAGLVAAAHLAARGLGVLLLEADPAFVGGRLKDGPPIAFEHHGRSWSFSAEHGVHGIWAPYVNLRATLERLGVPLALRPSEDEGWIHPPQPAPRSLPLSAPLHSPALSEYSDAR
jgi:cation diffusion facilitator CzcD-associated flavoprotein CzcO